MSGAKKIAVIRMATMLVITSPLPPGSLVKLSFDSDVTIWLPPGNQYFAIVDKRYLDEAWSADREAAVLRHLWWEMFDRGVVDSPTVPAVVEGDPQLMLV
jgi:hypothetical protein